MLFRLCSIVVLLPPDLDKWSKKPGSGKPLPTDERGVYQVVASSNSGNELQVILEGQDSTVTKPLRFRSQPSEHVMATYEVF